MYFLGLYPPNERRLADVAAASREHTRRSAIEAADRPISTAYLAHIWPIRPGRYRYWIHDIRI